VGGAHFWPSRVGSWSGSSLVWLTNSGVIISSIASRSPLKCASNKRRANAMFSSTDMEVPPCKLAFLQRILARVVGLPGLSTIRPGWAKMSCRYETKG
jgi:hypothetical protein